MLLYGPYIDFVASTLGAVAVLAALEKRRRTGAGSFLDVSQYECGLMFLAGPLLDYHTHGTLAERSGNGDPVAAPHGAWPCRNGGWLAVSCWSDAEFSRLCEAIAQPDLVRDARFATRAGRQSHVAFIGNLLADWARTREAHAAAELLQRAAVHAHAVNTIADLFTDAQLGARNLWRRRPHPVIGEQAYCLPAFDLSDTPGDITMAAPMLGEHNARVFRDVLGLDEQEFNALRDRGAMD